MGCTIKLHKWPHVSICYVFFFFNVKQGTQECLYMLTGNAGYQISANKIASRQGEIDKCVKCLMLQQYYTYHWNLVVSRVFAEMHYPHLFHTTCDCQGGFHCSDVTAHRHWLDLICPWCLHSVDFWEPQKFVLELRVLSDCYGCFQPLFPYCCQKEQAEIKYLRIQHFR